MLELKVKNVDFFLLKDTAYELMFVVLCVGGLYLWGFFVCFFKHFFRKLEKMVFYFERYVRAEKKINVEL